MHNNGWTRRRLRGRKTKRRRARMMLTKRKKIRRVALLCKIFVFHHRSSNAASINIQEVETCQNRNYLNFGPAQLLQHLFWCKKNTENCANTFEASINILFKILIAPNCCSCNYWRGSNLPKRQMVASAFALILVEVMHFCEQFIFPAAALIKFGEV